VTEESPLAKRPSIMRLKKTISSTQIKADEILAMLRKKSDPPPAPPPSSRPKVPRPDPKKK
jgi:hypothetical protein